MLIGILRNNKANIYCYGRTLLTPLLIALFCSGCVNHYQYSSKGAVMLSNGKKVPALLYWGHDEGLLWYGKKYRQTDSSVVLKICGLPSLLFNSRLDSELVLNARGGDQLAAELSSTGLLHAIKPYRSTFVGQACGAITLGSTKASVEQLRIKEQPQLSFWCLNNAKPLRYPIISNIQFQPIKKIKIKEKQLAPNPCANTVN